MVIEKQRSETNKRMNLLKKSTPSILVLIKKKCPKPRQEINFESFIKWEWSMSIILSNKMTTSLASVTTDKLWVKNKIFDTDGLEFAMDDCDNVIMSNDKENFNNLRIINLDPEITVAGEGDMSEEIGDATLSLKENNGANHEKTI